jgi:hypothetical protein
MKTAEKKNETRLERRAVNVSEIRGKDAKELILTRHYAGRMPTIQRAFGLFENEQLVGVCTFGQPASPWVKVSMFGHDWSGEIMELNRLVIITQTKNAASFLIGFSLRSLKGIPLVSYADQGVNHVGYVYQATNWNYAGQSKARTDIFSPSGHARHHGGDPSIRQQRSAKHRYWFCSDKRIAKQCLWPKLPYPKGETKRYDAARQVQGGSE